MPAKNNRMFRFKKNATFVRNSFVRNCTTNAVCDMEYRLLGNTGLKVSSLSFGFFATIGVNEGLDRCLNIMRICRNNGINLFDNAEVYGKNRGDSEIIMGQAMDKLKSEDPYLWRRSDLIISSKVFWGGDGQNEKGLSRKHLIEGFDGILSRLKTDYLDIGFCHRFDGLTTTEEIVDTMNILINQGKLLYYGTSEWTAQQITEAHWIAKSKGLIPPCVEQLQYNMLERKRFESEYQAIFKEPYNIGTTVNI